ncbi:hypothetical protein YASMINEVIRUS_654 [Yasminevirus sp. GU-2018]|uniref:Uncharacterized protein n=1 Tax=Yasminevirus sp. GU-2018 TaxID=2420051 RepID=A0A5K0U9E6_9VIRU|nr:hypothetical protein YASMINEVIRUS_654 [Yasminevirus sp. GU-2018]
MQNYNFKANRFRSVYNNQMNTATTSTAPSKLKRAPSAPGYTGSASANGTLNVIKGYLRKHWSGYNFPRDTVDSSVATIAKNIHTAELVPETVETIAEFVRSCLRQKTGTSGVYYYFDCSYKR